MRFNLDHDWQGNMSTPRAKVGEKAKTHLLIVLCTIWLCMGLIGHAPWKPFESHSISTIKTIIDTGNFLAPVSASNPHIINPPLYYLSAAGIAKLLSPLAPNILPLHDAARIATGLWMVITLLMVGMTGRELWGNGFGRQTTFVLIGSLGLVLSAHTLMPAVSALAGISISFYALSLAKRRPYRASILLGLGMGVSFLSTGLQPLAIILITCLALPCLFGLWRNTSYVKVIALALIFASPFLFGWPMLCHYFYSDAFNQWWALSLAQFKHSEHLYFLRTLLWYAWPALPLALWGIWRYRNQLLNKPSFQLILTFLVVAWAVIGFGEDNEVFALPLLIPLTAMAGGSIESLKRGTAGALSWFGLILFGLMSVLIWLGWYAMLTGDPAKIKTRMTFLSGLTDLNFSFIAFILAVIATLIWLFATFRTQYSNRSSATNWAIGMTCVWTLLMTLWLPMIDSARSYQHVFSDLKQALPTKYACVSSSRLGNAQRDLLHYFTDIKTQNFETEGALNCDLYLIQDERNREKIEPGTDWKLIWSGKRVSERKESFRLFQRI
jgi:4-amino-4-deoxy-L-arabinose transferase-like glycosyltransferase